MTSRGHALLVWALSALLSGLMLGGQVFYLFAVFAVLTLLFAGVSVLATRRRMRPQCTLSSAHTLRGEAVRFTLTLPSRSLLPVSPLEAVLQLGDHRESGVYSLSPRSTTSVSFSVPVAHVGEAVCAVSELILSDVLGLFRISLRPQCSCTLCVLPRPFPLAPLHFLSGEEGRALPNRVTEDLSAPADTRAYRSGDALKRIHWKLSARKRELIVRRFESPAPPDTLILLDCTPPGTPDHTTEAVRTLRDALCETALSAAVMQCAAASPVRLPFYGHRQVVFHSDRSGNTDALREMLALESFSSETPFDRVLHLELRRMRRTGATVMITSRLNASTVEAIKHIRRMGPSARLYLVTNTPDSPQDRPLIAQLQQSLVEVCYVSPA